MGIETAIGAIATGLGVGTATATVIFNVAVATVLSAASAILAKRGLPGSPDLSARTITNKGSYNPQQIIYGEALVAAGAMAYHNTAGIKNREMWAVHLLAGHECEAISDVWLDDRVITDAQINGGAAAGGAVDSGDFGPVRSQSVVEIYKHYGTSSQAANASLVSKFGDWTTAHQLRGITYAVTMFALWDKTEKLWESGDPRNVKFLVKGKIIYDPRLDTSPGANPDNASYFAWSDNAALCLADYLRDPKFSPLAGGVEASRIDWDAVVTAANICDTLVSIPGGTEKRFTCNGVLYGTADPEENVAALLSSMNGELVFSGDKYIMYAFAYTAPDVNDTIDEDDIIGPIGISSALDSDKRINTLKATFVDPDKNYEPTDTATITFSALKDTRDGGHELIDTLELPLTNSWYMAQRICQMSLQEHNQEMTISVPCNLRAARLQTGQRVSVTLTERSWSPKVFKVLGWSFFDRGENKLGVNLQLKEDDSAAYADPSVGEYNTTTGTGTLTLGEPELIPSVDTIPRGIRYGEGAWNIQIVKDSDDGIADSNDGEVYFNTGTFVTTDGSVNRTLATAGYVDTPYEGSTEPPDGVAYIVWGATNPDTRFGAAAYGDANAEAAGLFCAIYDRIREQWYAVDSAGTETAFTPADSDFVVARMIKTSASGGLDSLQSLVAFVENPAEVVVDWDDITGSGKPDDNATVGATTGTDLLDAEGNVITDAVITNFDDASALQFNGAFNDWTAGVPDGWEKVGSGTLSQETAASNVLTGSSSVKFVTNGSSGSYLLRSNGDQSPLISFHIEGNAVLVGSVDVKIVSRTSGTPGITADLLQTTGASPSYYRQVVPCATDKTGTWQRLFFKVSAYADNCGTVNSPTQGNDFVAVKIGLIADLSIGSTGKGALSAFNGTVVYDNVRFAILDPAIENEQQAWSYIVDDDGNKPADGATKNTITRGTASPTGGIEGDLYYETDAKAWWAYGPSGWEKVSDETAANTAAAITGQGALATRDDVLLGSSGHVKDESSNNLDDLDVLNGQIMTTALSSVVWNPYMSFPAKYSSTWGPSGWRIGNSNNYPSYVSDTDHDQADLNAGQTFVSSVFPPNTSTTYEVVARVRHPGGANDIALRVNHYNSDMPSEKIALGSGTYANGVQTRSGVTTLQTTSVGSTWTILRSAYIPQNASATSKWCNIDIYSTAAFEVDFVTVRTKSSKNKTKTDYEYLKKTASQILAASASTYQSIANWASQAGDCDLTIVSGTEIEFDVAGRYLIQAAFFGHKESGGTVAGAMFVKMQLNTGAGYVDQSPESGASTPNLTAQSDDPLSCTLTHVLDVGADDRIRYVGRSRQAATSNEIQLQANDCTIFITRLDIEDLT